MNAKNNSKRSLAKECCIYPNIALLDADFDMLPPKLVYSIVHDTKGLNDNHYCLDFIQTTKTI